MGRQTKRKHDNYNDFSDEEDEMTDEEWKSIQDAIKEEIKENDMVWDSILVYEELEDEWFWDPLNKPTVSEFVIGITEEDE